MQCEVYDTYITEAGKIVLHFDIIVPTHTPYEHVMSFGHTYLETIGQQAYSIQPERCRFCHIEQASEEVEQAIQTAGYFILPMEGCPTSAELSTRR